MDPMIHVQAAPTDSSGHNHLKSTDSVEVSSSWSVINSSKDLKNVISSGPLVDASYKMTLTDIVREDSCLELKPRLDNERCTVDITMKNRRKIGRIGIVSEASLLEIFRDFGEYATTVFAELFDEYEGATVYYAEFDLTPPTTDVSIQFTRINNKNRSTMFLYGIRLLWKESNKSGPLDAFNEEFNIMNRLLKTSFENDEKVDIMPSISSIFQRIDNDSTCRTDPKCTIQNNNQSPLEESRDGSDIVTCSDDRHLEILIDKKFSEMEQRLSEKIDLVEVNFNKKLNRILELLETCQK